MASNSKSDNTNDGRIKLLCSYGGKILPRHPNRELYYQGGETRVLAVDRSISIGELFFKLGQLCGGGSPVILRCKLPKQDLDMLVSVTSDEDFANIIQLYDFTSEGSSSSSPLKIRAFLWPAKSITKKASVASSGTPLATSSNKFCHHLVPPPPHPTKLLQAGRFSQPRATKLQPGND